MADVYGRLTGRVGVCLATLGPGATNLVTGVANANMDRSRLLSITGHTDSHLLHKESHQNLNVVKMFEQSLKDAKLISDKPIVIAVDVDYSRNEVLLDDSFPSYVQ